MGYIEDLRALIGHMRINLNGSVVILRDEYGRILMQERVYPRGKWGLPGGLMELGESTEDTARREIFEETGLSVGELKLLGVYSGKENLSVAQNGDEFYVIVTAYIADSYSGDLSVHDNESVTLQWIPYDDLPINIAKSHRRIIEDYIKM